jgi:hypothetical protein
MAARIAPQSHGLPRSTAPVTLSVSFYGPLLFDFRPRSQWVDIYAPYCPYHLAGFFFDDFSYSETLLWQGAQQAAQLDPAARAYTLHADGLAAHRGRPTVLQPATLAGAPPLYQPKNIRVQKDKVLFKLTVPRPELIYPLYTDNVQIVESATKKPKVWNQFQHYATGLRFFYRWDALSSVLLDVPGGSSVNLTPPLLDTLTPDLNQAMASIEVRYQGLGILDQNDVHSDARACFASLITLAGLTAWLNYGDGKGAPTSLTPNPPRPGSGPIQVRSITGADCHAPVILNNLDAL